MLLHSAPLPSRIAPSPLVRGILKHSPRRRWEHLRVSDPKDGLSCSHSLGNWLWWCSSPFSPLNAPPSPRLFYRTVWRPRKSGVFRLPPSSWAKIPLARHPVLETAVFIWVLARRVRRARSKISHFWHPLSPPSGFCLRPLPVSQCILWPRPRSPACIF